QQSAEGADVTTGRSRPDGGDRLGPAAADRLRGHGGVALSPTPRQRTDGPAGAAHRLPGDPGGHGPQSAADSRRAGRAAHARHGPADARGPDAARDEADRRIRCPLSYRSEARTLAGRHHQGERMNPKDLEAVGIRFSVRGLDAGHFDISADEIPAYVTDPAGWY